MSTATINGIAITRGRVTLRLVGAWDAELWVTGTDSAAVSGAVLIELGGVVLRGTATRAAADKGNSVSVRVVGGAGGLSSAVNPQGYVKATRGTVLADALKSGGETLSPLSDVATTGALLEHWSRRRGTVAEALRLVVDHAGASWRVLLDGTVWVGAEAWLPVTVDHTIENESPTNDRIRVTVEAASILPGTTFLDHQVAGVTYELTGRSLRAEVSFSGERDDLAGQLSALVRRESAGRDLERTFVARIAAQNGDGTLELTLADPDMPGLSQVPVRLGIPGVTSYQITPGIDCSMEYENGDPSKPFVSSFASGQALALTISSTGVTKLEGTSVEAGGQQSLMLYDVFAGIWEGLSSACAAHTPPISVPPLVGCNTLITKGG